MNLSKGFPNGHRDKVAEHKHNQRKYRSLIALFTGQILLLLLVFPLLFLYFENQRIGLEADNGVPGTVELHESYTYVDGLYWSMLTPPKLDSISDWPKTPPGRVLVRVSDITKVLTVAVLAALIYETSTGHLACLKRHR